MINRTCRIGLILLFTVLGACGGGSDGQATVSNETGKAAQAAGTLSLKWAAPSSRSDGVALSLSEIAGYTIYFGNSTGNYPYSVAVSDPSQTSIDIPDLPPGTYYLVMTTTDSQGQESGYSNVAVKEVS